MRGRLIVLACCLLATAAPRDSAAQRLPTTVTPEHYDLAFDVDLAAATFSGTETIRVRLAQPTRRVVLHALDLRLEDVTMASGGVTLPAAVSLDVSAQTATLVVPREMAAGEAEIASQVLGAAQHVPARLLSQPRQRPELRHHAVRGHRRAPRVSVLR